ncbi:hypothetical protein ACSE3M_17725 [Bacillus velezensis]
MAKNEPNKPDSVKTKLEESPVKKQTASIQETEVVSNAPVPEKIADKAGESLAMNSTVGSVVVVPLKKITKRYRIKTGGKRKRDEGSCEGDPAKTSPTARQTSKGR